jgi:hypothetical protein
MKAAYLLVICSLLMAPMLVAQQPEQIPDDFVRQLAPALVEQAGKFEAKIKIDADLEKANGFHVPSKLGALIVPQKDLKESAELAAKFQTEPGAPLGYLFMFHLIPIADGKKIDTAKMKTVSFKDNNGGEHSLHVVTLVVRQLSVEDYRLHVYGVDAKPLVDVKFGAGSGKDSLPAAVELKDPNEATKEGSVVVTVFGKYQAKFPAAYVE